MATKIYTKTGDDGTTSLFGGKRVPKNHERIEAYGTIDELNACLGLLVDALGNELPVHSRLLIAIQEELFVIGAWLASEDGKQLHLPSITPDLIRTMETSIDAMQSELPVLKNFILPGGHLLVSYAHIARTVCRRAERRIVAINEPLTHLAFFIEFLNRLSDYLFVLSRYLAGHFAAPERIWKAKAD